MAKTVLKTLEECEDSVRGCTVMGTGGGGAPERGMQLLSNALERGSELAWIDVEDVSDEGWTACTFGMGSIAPQTEETRKEIERLELEPADIELSRSIEELMHFAGVQLEAIVPIELGGWNSASPLVFGTQLGLPCVNGDYAGRAIPEEAQTTPVLAGKVSTPLSSVDRWGNVCFIKESASPGMTERIGKMLSVAAFGSCMMTGYLMRGAEMKQLVVPGTLTMCLELGRTIRKAREAGKDPVEAILSFTNGWLLFQGEVTEKEWEDRGGYMYGTTHLNGLGKFEGHKMSVWFKNENHVAWKDERPFVTSPDIIALVELESGEPKTNTALSAGDLMAMIGMKGLDTFRTPAGLKALGPGHFGFDIDYVPIEDVV